MPEDFDPTTHFTPRENARIQQQPLAREAARARSAAKRSAARGDAPARQIELRAIADAATLAEEENRTLLASFETQERST